MAEDRELAARASRGDMSAVEGLLERHLAGLVGYLRKRAADLAPKESAADIAQSACREVLSDLASGRVEYRGDGEFRAWLYEAALFKLRNRRRYWSAERRDKGREQAVGARRSKPDLEALAGGARTPSREAAAREEAERLAALIGELPERYGEVVRLARIEGLTHAEIAERLGVSEVTSRKLLSRALARLGTLGARGEE